jgi:ATP:corrinoid adenosyltransferase
MTQLKHHEDRLGQLRREIELLTRLQGLDHRVSDAEASRHFSLYVDQAKINGYGFQAHLVESKEIPKVQETINQIQEEILEYKKKVPEDVQRLAEKDWRWRQMAKEAGLLHEHDYIYAYANRLLHAKPASLTTDHKNIEMHEICMFLRYIYVKMLEIMDLARSQPEYKIRPTS